jgi:hypothetical protein
MTTDKLNPSVRCSLFSSRKTILRGWLTELAEREKWGHRKVTQEERLSRKSEAIPEREDKSMV